MKTVSKGELLIHFALVAISLILLNYPGFDLTIGVFNSGDSSLRWPSVTGTIINLSIFYAISFYLIPKVLRKRSLVSFLAQFILLVLTLSSLEVVLDLVFLGWNQASSDELSEIIITVTVFNLLFVVFAFAYRFSKDWFINEKQRISIGEWQARTELNTLKNQINPHFLFNALNSLFSMSLKSGDDKTAEGIGKLSEMMRYVFDKSNLDKVALVDEIQYIEDYIYLQKLRFEDSVIVDMALSGGFKDKYIAPMILIPFLENAFKYGVNSSQKNKISFRLTCEKEYMSVTISNAIVDQTESIPSSGVGLVNVRKRLELIYPERHKLDISRENGIFTVKIEIML